MQKYMYLTDPTLTNKITLLKDKNLDDKLIKIIIEGGTLKGSIEELNAKIDLIENNGESINATTAMLLKKDLETYYKRIDLLKTLGIELDSNELRNYMEVIINSPYFEEDINVLKQYMIRIVRKNSKYALDLFWKSPKELTLTLDLMIESSLENVIGSNPETLSLDVEELLKRIQYCKDNGIPYYNSDREVTESYVVNPLEFARKLPDANMQVANQNNDKIVGILGNDESFNELLTALDEYYAKDTLVELSETDELRTMIEEFEGKFEVDKLSNNSYGISNVAISKKKVERNLAILIDFVTKKDQSISNIEKELMLIAILHNLRVSEEAMKEIASSAMGFNQSVGGPVL